MKRNDKNNSHELKKQDLGLKHFIKKHKGVDCSKANCVICFTKRLTKSDPCIKKILKHTIHIFLLRRKNKNNFIVYSVFVEAQPVFMRHNN